MSPDRAVGAPVRRLTLFAGHPSEGLRFDHLLRLSDATGVLEHACGATPRREHGYCSDDVAPALVVLSHEAALPPELESLATTCFDFLAHAQAEDGRIRNRLGYDRAWSGEASTDDCWGRAVWAFGALSASPALAVLRAEALVAFELSASQRSPWPRALAFAALGCTSVLEVHDDNDAAAALLRVVLTRLYEPALDASWPWPEERLSYANAAVADALIGGGSALGETDCVAEGLRLLEWLVALQTRGDHLSAVPVAGLGRGETGPGFDQQPIEISTLATAAATAWRVTGDRRWSRCVEECVAWFLGRNDVGVALYDERSGGGFDGLEVDGRNENQGAESTLAALSTLQLAAALGFR